MKLSENPSGHHSSSNHDWRVENSYSKRSCCDSQGGDACQRAACSTTSDPYDFTISGMGTYKWPPAYGHFIFTSNIQTVPIETQ